VAYSVKASLVKGGPRFKAELETRQVAIRSAKELREQGFEVTITGPDTCLLATLGAAFFQFGLTSASMVPHFVHTIFGPNEGTVRSLG
jgi:hypothetical protein